MGVTCHALVIEIVSIRFKTGSLAFDTYMQELLSGTASQPSLNMQGLLQLVLLAQMGTACEADKTEEAQEGSAGAPSPSAQGKSAYS